MKFNSKHDLWLGIVIIMAVCVSGIGIFTARQSMSILLLSAVDGFILWIWFGTYYRIKGDILVIRSGPFVSKLDIHRIQTVRKTRNPISSPACSLDRICLRLSKKQVIISPKDKKAFCDALLRVNPNIDVRLDLYS